MMNITSLGMLFLHNGKICQKTFLATRLIFPLILALSLQASASTFGLSNIIGSVKNENGVALAGAAVFIKELHKAGITNENGEFILRRIRNGRYQVEIYFVGYERYRTEIDVTEHIFRLTAELKLLPYNLDEIRVIAYGSTTRRLNTGNSTAVSGEDIEEQPAANPLSDLARMVPGLLVVPDKAVAFQDLQIKESSTPRLAAKRLIEQSQEILSIGTRIYDLPGTTTSTTAYADSATRWIFTSRPINDLDCEIHMTATAQNPSNGKGTKAVGEIAIPSSIRFASNPLAILPDTIIQTRDMIKECSAYSYGGKLDFKLIVHRRYKDVKFSLTGFILFRDYDAEPGLRDVPFNVSIK